MADPTAASGRQASTFRARWAALRNIGPFLRMVWRASPGLLLITLTLRVIRAVLPVAALWFGKLIIDEVVRLSVLSDGPATLSGWASSGEITLLAVYVGAEFALAVLSDLS